jgi:hypothetical protein
MERKQPSHGTALIIITICLVLPVLFLAGCHSRSAENEIMNREINVFGIGLFVAQNYGEIKGVAPVKEPCMKGYEYFYEPLDISIGYGTKGYVRKITTRNRETSMFSIRVGDSFAEGKEKIAKAGFKKGDTPYRFVSKWCSLTFLVNEKQEIFGLSVEVLD